MKGAIDSRIAEEQARQRQAALAASPGRPSSIPVRRNLRPDGSPARTSSRQRATRDASSEGAPDPSTFEPEFVVGEDESAVPSRVATPKPEVSEKQDGQQEVANGNAGQLLEDAETLQENDAVPSQQAELPTETLSKLRRLEKLETKYRELLRAYRIAHAQAATIGPFEATLQENTPLTSIADPSSFVEYLNQVNLKGDMVLDELKRVSADRDSFKTKFEQSAQRTEELEVQLEGLKTQQNEPTTNGSVEDANGRPSLEVATKADVDNNFTEVASAVKSPATNSMTSRVPSFSLFSPKTKAVKSPPPKEAAEEFFSYDTEVPKLESQVGEQQAEIEGLTKQLESLKGDLAVARESTEGMVQSLEAATRELHTLRDGKDKFDSTQMEMQQTVADRQQQVDKLESRIASLEGQIQELETERTSSSTRMESNAAAMDTLKTENSEKAARLAKSDSVVEELRERLSQKEASVKDLEDTLAMQKSAERQEAKQADISSQKRIDTMQQIMDSLKSQLQTAETQVVEIRNDLWSQQKSFEQRRCVKLNSHLNFDDDSGIDPLQNKEDALTYLTTVLDKQHDDGDKKLEEEADTSLPQKTGKKNKKKKKKGNAAGSAPETPMSPEQPVKVTEDLAEAEVAGARVGQASNSTSHTQEQVDRLRAELNQKSAVVDRLTLQVRELEPLKEEIETLRDDLLHQGEEHVQARDALKAAQAEKSALQESIKGLEKELAEAHRKVTAGADSEHAHNDLAANFKELKAKSTALQIDIAAAEQLAAARFKDITDLRELLSKSQPELRSLRGEVKELKVSNDELKGKEGELRRLESRHEDLKADLKGLGRKLADKDSEVKDFQKNVDQETINRMKAEDDLRQAQSDLHFSEATKHEAIEKSEQTSRDLSKAKEESAAMHARLSALEDQITTHTREVTDLREEVSLKASLHASSQSLLQNMRDQSHELSIQAHEATNRAESLEEELADSQRMLSERSREGETMRRLLNEAETKTESKLRDMKERMETAMEERDRAEDEASINARRLAREMDDLRNKARDAAKALKVVEDEKDELQYAQRDWKRRRDELESNLERSTAELNEVRTAMAQLREALDESERQVQDLEKQRTDLRRTGEETQQRLEKLTKANKALNDELKVLQQTTRKISTRPGGLDSGVQSSRSSIDSPGPHRTNSAIGSPAPTRRSETPTRPDAKGIDYVYLKNVLLQFLEQKDKGHQKQLIPVLGMLLHFDR